MSTASICTACRGRLSRLSFCPTKHAIRTLAHTASTRAPPDGKAIGAITALFGRGSGGDAGREGEAGSDSKERVNNIVRGRYSGKELRPEELLHQLEPEAAAAQQQQQHRQRSTPTRRYQNQPQRRHTPPHEALKTLPQDLLLALHKCYESAEAKDLASAWLALQDVERMRTRSSIGRKLIWSHELLKSVSSMLRQSTQAWLHSIQHGATDPALPTPYQILLFLATIHSLRAQFTRPTLWRMTNGLTRQRFSSSIPTANMSSALEDVVKTWRLCMAVNMLRESRTDLSMEETYLATLRNETDWSFLPPMSTIDSWPHARRGNSMFEAKLTALVYSSRSQGNITNRGSTQQTDFASSALITWDLLQSLPHGIAPSLVSPLISLFGSLLRSSSNPRIPQLLQNELAETTDPILLNEYQAMLVRLNCDNVESFLSTLRETATTATPSQSSAADQHPEAAPDSYSSNVGTDSSNTLAERFARTVNIRLGRALEQKSLPAAQRLHREVSEYSLSHGGTSDALPIHTYEQLLLVFLSMKNPKIAVEIWNFMIKLGYKPTVKTYTVMMRGAQTARDLDGMEAFWQKMRQSGCKPDTHAWSTRIVTLLKLRNGSPGFDAMHEMSREWLAAAKADMLRERPADTNKTKIEPTPSELIKAYPGPVNGVARPTVDVMNAAISVLASFKPDSVSKVFSWGRSFGIEPNLYTYNALLGVAMYMSRTEEAFSILQHMQGNGMHPDSTTWSVLLKGLFESGFLDNINHSEQEKRIIAFIEALHDPENGIPGIDDKGYALVIDRLIKTYENFTAAAAVLSHMTNRGMQPSHFIYTILMTSYFQKQPQPDFAAIESLWQQIRDQGNGFAALVDVTFFDRMIEGYAKNHHIVGTKPMEEFIKACQKAGKQPGWTALLSVAKVYAERNQTQKLRNLVDELMMLYSREDGRTARHGWQEFWAFVQSTGIIREEDMPKKRTGSMMARAAI